MACAKPTLAVGNELVVWPATLVVSMASENRAMLGRRPCQAAGLTGFGTRLRSTQAHTGQYWRSIGRDRGQRSSRKALPCDVRERSATQQIADAVCRRQPVKAPALTGLASSLLPKQAARGLLPKQAARAANVAGHITRLTRVTSTSLCLRDPEHGARRRVRGRVPRG